LEKERSTHTGTQRLLENKLLACVHCGLCLEACPTYVQTGNENDSPRGRIYLMRAVEEGRLASTSFSFERHINRCLGCRACETACPAGVEYGQLLEGARAKLSEHRSKKLSYRILDFVLRYIWPYPTRLRTLFTLSRIARDTGLVKLLIKTKLASLISKQFTFALSLLDASSPTRFNNNRKSTINKPIKTEPQSQAMLFKGCIMDSLFKHVNRATERVLEANGCKVTMPVNQVCCGALHAHSGNLDIARELARRNIDAFEDSNSIPIITNAGGCGAMLCSYGHLLANDPNYAERAELFSARIRDIGQQLKTIGTQTGAPIPEALTTYDASCHLLYGQHASDESLKILSSIPELKLVPLEGSEMCCGGAGVYNLMEPQMSNAVLEEKLKHIRETGAEVLTTGNPGCQLQIAAGAKLSGMELKVCHPIELLDQSYQQAGLYSEE
jgi:glycolate oxidase iron-sulfur subunit